MIYNGVLFLMFKIDLRNWFCITSSILQFSNPQISQEYVKIGRIVLSNNLSCRSMGRFKLLILIL